MTRIDYYYDDAAPKANSLVVAVSAVIRDEHGRVLMIERTDNDLYAIPGGGMEPGETVEQAVIREVLEETGITCEIGKLVGIYSDPHHVIAFDDGEVRQEFSICFTGSPVGGELRESEESRKALWIDSAALGELNIHPSIRLRIFEATHR